MAAAETGPCARFRGSNSDDLSELHRCGLRAGRSACSRGIVVKPAPALTRRVLRFQSRSRRQMAPMVESLLCRRVDPLRCCCSYRSGVPGPRRDPSSCVQPETTHGAQSSLAIHEQVDLWVALSRGDHAQPSCCGSVGRALALTGPVTPARPAHAPRLRPPARAMIRLRAHRLRLAATAARCRAHETSQSTRQTQPPRAMHRGVHDPQGSRPVCSEMSQRWTWDGLTRLARRHATLADFLQQLGCQHRILRCNR